MSIKDFLNRRLNCPICSEKLHMSATYFNKNMNLSLIDNLLNFKTDHIDFSINILTNDVKNNYIKHNTNILVYGEMKLLLHCNNHMPEGNYKKELIFDIYNNTILNGAIVEKLITKNFSLISDPPRSVCYSNNRTKYTTNFHYFDYSNMDLSKLENKIKTYLLLQ